MSQKVKVKPRRSVADLNGNGVAAQPIPLDRLIDYEDTRHPGLRDAVELGVERRQVLSRLAGFREAHGLSQHEVARRMGTMQPAVARLESGVVDPKFSTLQRYADAVGLRIELLNGAVPSATGTAAKPTPKDSRRLDD